MHAGNSIRTRRRTQKGFSIIEVLISMGMLAFAIAGLAQLYTSVSENVRSSENMTTAMEIARSRVDELAAFTDAAITAISCPTAANPACQAAGGTGFTAAPANCSFSMEQFTPLNYTGGALGSNVASTVVPSGGSARSDRYRVDVSIIDHTGTFESYDRLLIVNVCWRDGTRVRQVQSRQVLLPQENI